MRKFCFILFFTVLSGAVFAGSTMDASMVSEADIIRMESIAEALDPIVAIEAAITSFGGTHYPLANYLEMQKMKINLIFNEYGVEFNQYVNYQGLSQRAQVVFSRLKSRYSYLNSINLQNAEQLRATLALLRQ